MYSIDVEKDTEGSDHENNDEEAYEGGSEEEKEEAREEFKSVSFWFRGTCYP